jgi:hypothetical protein
LKTTQNNCNQQQNETKRNEAKRSNP